MNYEKMPFGKYKGVLINDLPATYKCYALQEFDLPIELKIGLLVGLIEDLKGWELIDNSYRSKTKIKEVYNTLAKKYHPDKGGSDEAMKVINEFNALLK